MIYESTKKTFDNITRVIQIRVTPYGYIEQRHLFFESQDSAEPNIVGDWINSHTRNLQRATKGFSLVNEQLPHQEAIKALEAIRDGHNDPRQCARDALLIIQKYD